VTDQEAADRQYSASVSAAFTSVATFLGGFSFAATTVLVGLADRSPYFKVVLFVTAFSALVWVALAALGAFLTVAASSVHLRDESPLFGVASVFAFGVYFALVLFFVNVPMLAFLVSRAVGLVVSGASAVVGVLLGLALVKISNHWAR
jgi:hypothetical protein